MVDVCNIGWRKTSPHHLQTLPVQVSFLTLEKRRCVWLCWQFSYIQTCTVVQKLLNYFFCHLCIINYRNYKQHWLKKEVIYFIFLKLFYLYHFFPAQKCDVRSPPHTFAQSTCTAAVFTQRPSHHCCLFREVGACRFNPPGQSSQ